MRIAGETKTLIGRIALAQEFLPRIIKVERHLLKFRIFSRKQLDLHNNNILKNFS